MTDTMDVGETEVIKLDRMGRSRYTQQYREKVLDAFEQSGMTCRAFAQQCGVKYQTFATWMQKRKRAAGELDGRQQPSSPGEPKFLLAEIRKEEPAAGLTVTLPSGAVVHASSREQLPLMVELLRALS